MAKELKDMQKIGDCGRIVLPMTARLVIMSWPQLCNALQLHFLNVNIYFAFIFRYSSVRFLKTSLIFIFNGYTPKTVMTIQGV